MKIYIARKCKMISFRSQKSLLSETGVCIKWVSLYYCTKEDHVHFTRENSLLQYMTPTPWKSLCPHFKPPIYLAMYPIFYSYFIGYHAWFNSPLKGEGPFKKGIFCRHQ